MSLHSCWEKLRRDIAWNDWENLGTVELVERYRQFWRPERVRVVLLAESHVFTTSEETGSLILPHHQLPGPDRFVRFVYCLGYGERDLLSAELANNSGTPQYWKLFSTTVRPPVDPEHLAPNKANFPELAVRLRKKVELLEEMKRRGIWLIDASTVGIYRPGGTRPPANVTRGVLRICWEAWVRQQVEQCRPNRVIVIGRTVLDHLGTQLTELGNQLGFDVHWIHQPQAHLTAATREAEYQRLHQWCQIP